VLIERRTNTLHPTSQRSQRGFPASLGSLRNRGGPTAADDLTDDGCCSVISEEDLDQHAWAQSQGAVEYDALLASASNTDESLRQQLSIEVQRRKELEQKIQAMELGAPASGQALTRLEAALRSTHEEVNTLVGEVILKGKQKQKGDPSLLALLEATNASLTQIIQEKPNVSSMKLSAPVDRQPKSSCCLS
jgi:hypothetical protein